MRSLDVAAPTTFVDPLTPWVEPCTRSEKATSAAFWVGFHGWSALAHAIAIFLSLAGTLLPIPFLAAMCAEVKAVEKPIERVEMAIVEVKPPPPPELELALAAGTGDGVALRKCAVDADCGDDERCVDDICVASDKEKKKKKKKKKELEAVAMMGILGTLSDNQISGIFTADVLSGDSNALGGLIGNSVGESFGTGGLGLRGTGSAGGALVGRGEGLGSIGTIGKGGGGAGYGTGYGMGGLGTKEPPARVQLTLDGASAATTTALERELRKCRLTDEVHGVLQVEGGRVVGVSSTNACVRVRMRAARGLSDGAQPFVASPIL